MTRPRERGETKGRSVMGDIMTTARKLLFVIVSIVALGNTVACEREGPMERAGEKVDKAVEEAGDKVEKATDR
jgi:hypothetical protein